MKRIALALTLLGTACAAPLATLPRSDSYTVVDQGSVPPLSKDEQRLVNDINTELQRVGLPAATPGAYEMNVAAVMANVALAKIWNGSGRHFGTEHDLAAAGGGTKETESKHDVAGGRFASMTDEEDDSEVKHLHTGQHLTSHGIAPLMVKITTQTYATTALSQDDLRKLLRPMYPPRIAGKLKVGVAVLPVGDADTRIFVVTLHDWTYELTKGAPRTAEPGSSFELAGRVIDPQTHTVQVGVQGPDGKVQLLQLPVDPQGNFQGTVPLASAPGVYVLELTTLPAESQPEPQSNDVYQVPIFVGVAPSPWPVSKDPKAAAIDGTRSLAQRLAQLISDYRRAHGLPQVPIDSNLSALAKSEVTQYAKVVDATDGPDSAAARKAFAEGYFPMAHSAAVDTADLRWNLFGVSGDYLADYIARFPWSIFAAARLNSPTLQAIGIGVALVPNEVTKDADLTRYTFAWVTKDPAPPEFKGGASATAVPTATSEAAVDTKPGAATPNPPSQTAAPAEPGTTVPSATPNP